MKNMIDHPKMIQFDNQMKAMLDAVDNYIEDKYGDLYPLHPGRPKRNETANPQADGLFSVRADFTPGYGSDLGRGYILKVEMKTLADIPDDVNTVIAYSPTKDYSENAVKKLRNFLYNDGKYTKSMIYIPYRNKAECPNIDKLLEEYGMAVSDGLAFDMDTSRQMSSASSYSAYRYIAASFSSKLYTDNITKDSQTVLADYSRAVISKNENITQPLISYSSNSGICPFDATDDWNPKDYIVGNVCIMMQGLSGNDKAQSRLIVSGSTEMWSETIMQSQFINQEYWFNIVDTLNHREDNSVHLEDKVITDYSLQNISRQTSVIVGVVMFAVIPVLIIGAGIMVYVFRRRK